jgi:hypothetical protein
MSYAIDERNPKRQRLLARRFPTRRSTSCSAAIFWCISPTRRAPQPNIGRTLVRGFKQAGASHVEGGAMLHLEDDAASRSACTG